MFTVPSQGVEYFAASTNILFNPSPTLFTNLAYTAEARPLYVYHTFEELEADDWLTLDPIDDNWARLANAQRPGSASNMLTARIQRGNSDVDSYAHTSMYIGRENDTTLVLYCPQWNDFFPTSTNAITTFSVQVREIRPTGGLSET